MQETEKNSLFSEISAEESVTINGASCGCESSCGYYSYDGYPKPLNHHFNTTMTL